ncbi:cytosolic non-specific dipeptidase-like [Harmonia axyridis]|uniref:cytosolic non-specific dipeptidase-like n=1 Tax=Harmonia axyridis TaxID=115357 RepID=UPI001E27770B|nr:cytosolic non-specific dipeptidase-like [Harmonia axyridis]
MSVIFPHIFRTEHSETHTTNAEYGDYFVSRQRGKISVGPALATLMKYVDSHVKNFLSDLTEAVAIKSVSGDIRYRNDLISMIKWTEKWMKRLEFKYECFYVGLHSLNGQKVKIPPVILASHGNDSKKKTVCVYGYLDVKLPNLEEWKTDPWTLTQVDKRFYGAGTSSGKGILLCWFHIIEAFKKKNIPLPVNIKFVIESMNHQNSMGLQEFLQTKKLDFFSNVNCMVSCDGEWIGEKYPCIIYGTVGHLVFDILAEQKDNSDIKADMENLMSKLYDQENERILIPTFNDFVKQITPDEEGVYEAIQEFDIEKIRPSLPPNKQKWDKVKLLMHFWRLPNMHISNDMACSCENPKKMIKRQVIVKLVQRQVMDKAMALFTSFVENKVSELGIKSIITCKVVSEIRHWAENIRSWNYEAARKATIQTYKEEPSFIREDRPMTSISNLDGTLEKNILVLPLVGNGSNTGEANENISYRNLFEGTKLLAAYLIQLSEVKEIEKPNI